MSMDYKEAGKRILDQNSDEFHLNWIHDRLVNVHGENENFDYMLRLRKIIKRKSELACGAGNDKTEWKAGELPPVNIEFEIFHHGQWFKCFVLMYDEGIAWVKQNTGHCSYNIDRWLVRPIQTDKERVINEAIEGVDKILGAPSNSLVTKNTREVLETAYDLGILTDPDRVTYPNSYTLVPNEPTEAMLEVAPANHICERSTAEELYKEMLKVAKESS